MTTDPLTEPALFALLHAAKRTGHPLPAPLRWRDHRGHVRSLDVGGGLFVGDVWTEDDDLPISTESADLLDHTGERVDTVSRWVER